MPTDRTFVESSVARVVVRPGAIAYVIRPGDHAAFIKAVEYACSEWGGIGQPIMTLGNRLRAAPLYEQQIGVMEPEAVIDFAGLSRDDARKLGMRWKTRVVPERELAWHPPGAIVAIARDRTELEARTIFTTRPRLP